MPRSHPGNPSASGASWSISRIMSAPKVTDTMETDSTSCLPTGVYPRFENKVDVLQHRGKTGYDKTSNRPANGIAAIEVSSCPRLSPQCFELAGQLGPQFETCV